LTFVDRSCRPFQRLRVDHPACRIREALTVFGVEHLTLTASSSGCLLTPRSRDIGIPAGTLASADSSHAHLGSQHGPGDARASQVTATRAARSEHGASLSLACSAWKNAAGLRQGGSLFHQPRKPALFAYPRAAKHWSKKPQVATWQEPSRGILGRTWQERGDFMFQTQAQTRTLHL